LNLNNLYNDETSREYRFGSWDYGDNGYRIQNRSRNNLVSKQLGVTPYIGGRLDLVNKGPEGEKFVREEINYKIGYDVAAKNGASPIIADVEYQKKYDVGHPLAGLGYDLGLNYSSHQMMNDEYQMEPYSLFELKYRVKKDIGNNFVAYGEGRNYFSENTNTNDSKYRLGLDYEPSDLFNVGIFGEFGHENLDVGKYQDVLDVGLHLGTKHVFRSSPKYQGKDYLSAFSDEALDGIATAVRDNTNPKFKGTDRFLEQFRGGLDDNGEKVTEASKRDVAEFRGFGLVKLGQGAMYLGTGLTATFPYEFRKSNSAKETENGYSIRGGYSLYGKFSLGIDQTLTPYTSATFNLNSALNERIAVSADCDFHMLGLVPYYGGQVNVNLPVTDSVDVNIGMQNGVTYRSNSGDTYGFTGGLNADRIGVRFKKSNVHFGTMETTVDVCMPNSSSNFFPVMVNTEKKPGVVAHLESGKTVSFDGDREVMLTGGSRQKFNQINEIFEKMQKIGITMQADDETLNSLYSDEKDAKRMEYLLQVIAKYKQDKVAGFSFLKSVKLLPGKFFLNPVNWFSTESMFIEEGSLYISQDAFDKIDFKKPIDSQIVFRATPVNIGLSRWIEKIAINNKLTERRAMKLEKMGNIFIDSEVLIEGTGNELLIDENVDGIISYLEFVAQSFNLNKVRNRTFTIKLSDNDNKPDVITAHNNKKVIIDLSMVKSFALRETILRRFIEDTIVIDKTGAFKEKSYGKKIEELVADISKMGVDVRSDNWSEVRMDYLYESLKAAKELLSERLNKPNSGLGHIFGSTKYFGINQIYIGDKNTYIGEGVANFNVSMVDKKLRNIKSYVADSLEEASYKDSSQLMVLHNDLQKVNEVNANRLDFIKTTYDFIPGRIVSNNNGSKDISYVAANIGKKELGDHYEIIMRLVKDNQGKFNEPQISIRKLIKNSNGKYTICDNSPLKFVSFSKFTFDSYGVGFLEAFIDSVGVDDRLKDSAVPGLLSIVTRSNDNTINSSQTLVSSKEQKVDKTKVTNQNNSSQSIMLQLSGVSEQTLFNQSLDLSSAKPWEDLDNVKDTTDLELIQAVVFLTRTNDNYIEASKSNSQRIKKGEMKWFADIGALMKKYKVTDKRELVDVAIIKLMQEKKLVVDKNVLLKELAKITDSKIRIRVVARMKANGIIVDESGLATIIQNNRRQQMHSNSRFGR
ncbi:MAG: hypothetical protein WCH76_01670, partial [Candidatus Riflemargulisbacteria bacterium]